MMLIKENYPGELTQEVLHNSDQASLWIIKQLHKLIRKINDDLASYRFSDATIHF